MKTKIVPTIFLYEKFNGNHKIEVSDMISYILNHLHFRLKCKRFHMSQSRYIFFFIIIHS
jgi:hypothetical protein